MSSHLELNGGQLQKEVAHQAHTFSAELATDHALRQHIIRTPMRQTYFDHLNRVLVKSEHEQPGTRTFKSRGAYFGARALLDGLSPAEQAQGLVTVSAGNHAQGVALAGNLLGVPAYAVMPEGTPQVKQEGVRKLGGKAIIFGEDFEAANAHCAQNYDHLTFLSPFDNLDVIAGQATLAVELLEQMPTAEYIGVGVGGGGLLAGVGSVVEDFNQATGRQVKVIGFESESMASMRHAWCQGHVEPLPYTTTTVAEGTAVRQVGEIPFSIVHDLIEKGVVELATVTEEDLRAGIVELHEGRLAEARDFADLHDEDVEAVHAIEGAGALPFIGMRQYALSHHLAQRHMAVVASGGNMSDDLLASLQKEYATPPQAPQRVGNRVLHVIKGPTAR
jgi:threonine dehydratase